MSRGLIALAALIPLVAAVGAEPLDRIPNPRARDGTWVTDMPGKLSPETVARLNATIGEFERTNGAEMAVVVIRSLDGLPIEEAAVKLFELWGIGKKGKDNGLLLLWSTDDRRVRVEVGYGLEGVLNDGKVGAILDAYVIPRFRSGEFDEGVLAGVDALLSAAREEPLELPSQRSESYDDDSPVIETMLLGLLGLLPISVGSLVGFRKWRRYHRRRCPACQMPMTRLGESHDNAFLGEGQQAEERIKSVDYDVWKCAGCGHHFTLRYPKWITSYARCPQCSHRTKSSTETTVVAATTTSSGTARVVETCEFCTFHREHTKTLPRIQPSSSSSGGSSGGGSSSSFGGGRSGGGGASRGY
ncbi:MAG TPA: TPM domain-containing protein [Vicinamibacterales bacterium]|nr:TPM domain-containing protein [Vicinamibacterales bacterium]